MSANRTICANNMRELALALHNYQDVYKSFPSGTIVIEELPPEERLSWIIALFPFLEKDNYFQQIDIEKAWNAPENHLISEGIYNHFRCNEFPDAYGSLLNSYVGMAGIGKDAALLPLADPKVGVFGYDRKIKFTDVKDGLSTTMMVIETNFENGPWGAGGFPTVRGIDPDGSAYLGTAGQFGSFHRTEESTLFKTYPQCSNCLFVDGSVRKLVVTMDSTTFEALTTIAGGEKVELPIDY